MSLLFRAGESGSVILVKTSIYILSAYILLGLTYQFLFLKDADFDLHKFLAYSVATFLLLMIEQSFRILLVDSRQDHPESPRSTRMTESRVYDDIASGMAGGFTLPFLTGIPLLCVALPPVLALWGYDEYSLGDFVIGALGLTFLTTTVTKLAFFGIWFLAGSFIVHWGIRASWDTFRLLLESPDS
ncbi:MAG: hypothetical protein ACE5NA_07985 [Nitrospiraceae bacterium]